MSGATKSRLNVQLRLCCFPHEEIRQHSELHNAQCFRSAAEVYARGALDCVHDLAGMAELRQGVSQGLSSLGKGRLDHAKEELFVNYRVRRAFPHGEGQDR